MDAKELIARRIALELKSGSLDQSWHWLAHDGR